VLVDPDAYVTYQKSQSHHLALVNSNQVAKCEKDYQQAAEKSQSHHLALVNSNFGLSKIDFKCGRISSQSHHLALVNSNLQEGG